MKQNLFSIPLTLALVFLLFVRTAAASGEGSLVVPGHKEIVKLSAAGLEPQRIVLPEFDSSVFFLNTTRDGLASLVVDFGKKRAHCASANMKFNDQGTMMTVKAIGPRDFAILCFPEPGEYPITAQGLDGTTKKYTGTVVVK